MTAETIDGIVVSSEDPCFALSVSDILYGDMLMDRIASIRGLADAFPRLRFVCVRNDSMDATMFAAAAEAAADTGLGMILESADPVCLAASIAAVPGHSPLICMTDADRLGETAILSVARGCPVSVPGGDVESLMENVEAVEGYGVGGIVLCPGYGNMKGCLETNTDLCRLASRGFEQACHPILTRTWSGEYALSVASVSVMRGGALMVLDDLDRGSCEVLETLISSLDSESTL